MRWNPSVCNPISTGEFYMWSDTSVFLCGIKTRGIFFFLFPSPWHFSSKHKAEAAAMSAWIILAFDAKKISLRRDKNSRKATRKRVFWSGQRQNARLIRQTIQEEFKAKRYEETNNGVLLKKRFSELDQWKGRGMIS